jgi:hypothetical protein
MKIRGLLNTKTQIILSLMLLHSIVLTAQQKQVTLDIGKDAKIYNISRVADSGMVIFTGHTQTYGVIGNLKSTDHTIAYYDRHLNNIWNYHPAQNEFESFFVSSNHSDMIYWMDYDDDYDDGIHASKPTQTKRITMTRFKSSGEAERLDLKVNEMSKDVDLLGACIDKTHLYVFSYNIPTWEKPENPRSYQEIFMYTMGHKESRLTKKKVNIDLDASASLNFLGIDKGVIYFSQQKLIQENQLSIEVFKITTEGELIESFKINTSIDGYFRPHAHKKNLDGAQIRNNGDYYIFPYYSVYNDNHFAELKMNFEKNECYVSAFAKKGMNQAFANKDGSKISGYLFETYSLKGEKIHSYQVSIETLLEGEKEYSEKILSANSYLTKLDSNTLKLVISGIHSTAALTLNSDKILTKSIFKRYYNTNIEYMNNYDPSEFYLNLYAHPDYAPQSYVDYVKTIKKGNSNSVRYCAVNLGRTYILIKYILSKKGNQVELLLFD